MDTAAVVTVVGLQWMRENRMDLPKLADEKQTLYKADSSLVKAAVTLRDVEESISGIKRRMYIIVLNEMRGPPKLGLTAQTKFEINIEIRGEGSNVSFELHHPKETKNLPCSDSELYTKKNITIRAYATMLITTRAQTLQKGLYMVEGPGVNQGLIKSKGQAVAIWITNQSEA